MLKEGALLFSGREVVAATKKPQVFRPVAGVIFVFGIRKPPGVGG